jgi:hypothetical protein
MAKRVQVVLNEDVLSLGKDGDLVDVAPGYARNFLVPTGKAVPVTAAVLRQVEHRRAKEAERQAALKAEAEAFRKALSTIGRFTVKNKPVATTCSLALSPMAMWPTPLKRPPAKPSTVATSWCPTSTAPAPTRCR